MLDERPIEMFEMKTNQNGARIYGTRMTVPDGKHRVRAVVRRVKEGLAEAEALRWKSGPLQKGAVFAEWMELEGPLETSAQTMRRIDLPNEHSGKKAAREFISGFAQRAYRRPLQRDEEN